jgi:hypothetical protein
MHIIERMSLTKFNPKLNLFNICDLKVDDWNKSNDEVNKLILKHKKISIQVK